MPAKTSFVLVVGAGPNFEHTDGAASHLRQLGAEVRTMDLWGDPFRVVASANGPPRAVLIEAGDRPDHAVGALKEIRRVRCLQDTPAILCIPKGQVARVEPSSGFDDFILTPYVPEELYARIRSLEWKKSEFSNDERLKMGRLVIDRAAHEVFVEGRRVVLTAKEFSLLSFFVANRGRLVAREAILIRVWGVNYEGGARTVDIHVRRLRAKLGDALPIETLRGAGYKLPSHGETDLVGEPDDELLPSARASSYSNHRL